MTFNSKEHGYPWSFLLELWLLSASLLLGLAALSLNMKTKYEHFLVPLYAQNRGSCGQWLSTYCKVADFNIHVLFLEETKKENEKAKNYILKNYM